MTFWPLTNSDLPTNQTFHQFHDLYTELDLHRIMSGFHGAFATGVASQQGTLTLPDTWFRPPFWNLLMLQLLRPNSSNLPCLYSTFHLEYPLVLFSILLCSVLIFEEVPIRYWVSTSKSARQNHDNSHQKCYELLIQIFRSETWCLGKVTISCLRATPVTKVPYKHTKLDESFVQIN